MRCIETSFAIQQINRVFDKLQHEMYWNIGRGSNKQIITRDKLQHEMYWNKT